MIDELDLLNHAEKGAPLIWLGKHREERNERYLTIESLLEYDRSVPPIETRVTCPR